MKFFSTNNPNLEINLEEAIFRGLPPDNGLYMPSEIPELSADFFQNIASFSFNEIAFQVSHALIGNEIPVADLKNIIDNAMTFDAPLINIHDNIYSLELFHGPSLAFKDFGARFMASLMSYYLEKNKTKEINILVATSGDTGSAVAQGFLKMPNIKVTILYPSGGVSDIQEKQLTTLGYNITALEVAGTFDDCQKMVKAAFLDKELSEQLNLSSANSINISRLIPQAFYYFYAYSRLGEKPLVFSVPSGNFGNLCAGVIAKKMGLPVHKFIASTNVNNVIPEYLNTGIYTPRASIQTIANAMDVGNPSNFARLNYIYGNNVEKMRQDIIGKSYTDEMVRTTLKTVDTKYGYTLDPHGAIAYMGLSDFLAENKNLAVNGIFLETAHPGKFCDDVESILKRKLTLPLSLQASLHQVKQSIKIAASFEALKSFLL